MLLAIDVGNSNIVIGIYDGQNWIHHWRLETRLHKTVDEYQVFLSHLMAHKEINLSTIDYVIVSSVVPRLTGTMALLSKRLLNIVPLIVSTNLYNTGLNPEIDLPSELGSDLLSNSVAAWEKNKVTPSLVIDFGTALTFTAILPEGKIAGVSIMPGLNTALEGLANKTAQLPLVQMVPPPSVLGMNTIHAIQSGMVYGFTSTVEGMVKRFKAELGADTKVIATGGLSIVIAPLTDCINEIDRWHTLNGLKILADLNPKDKIKNIYSL